jgi:hypothetical protein
LFNEKYKESQPHHNAQACEIVAVDVYKKKELVMLHSNGFLYF